MTASRQDKADAVWRCGFRMAWVSLCGKPTSEGAFCAEHTGKACRSCGAQATHECGHAGQFICGAPLCDACEGDGGDSSQGLGWGFMGHTHRRKERSAPAEGAAK